MPRNFRFTRLFLSGCATLAMTSGNLWAAGKDSAKEALELKPVQKEINVPFDQPTKDQIAKCTLQDVKDGKTAGWVVADANGQTLRRFLDTNGDNQLDQWSYFRDGIEIYREVDSNFNRKADSYRWLGTAGLKWGIDDDENGTVDRWKTISPEEVTAEFIAAVRENNTERFRRLLMTKEELKQLGLDEGRTNELSKKIGEAVAGFPTLTSKQKLITAASEWTNFGATQPGVFPAGTDGSTKDVIVYENAAAMVENNGKSVQVPIGTLVQVGTIWRLIDLPNFDTSAAVASHFFLPIPGRVDQPSTNEPTLTPELQKLAASLERIDLDISKAKPEQVGDLYARKVGVLEQLYESATTDEDRSNWIRELADALTHVAESTEDVEAVERLKELSEKLAKDPKTQTYAAAVSFRYLTARYSLDIKDTKADFGKIQAAWLDGLEKFVTDYPMSPDIPEALQQLAIGQEFAGKSEEAARWFGKIASDFPQSDVATKAQGAKRRLSSKGKTFEFSGTTTTGRPWSSLKDGQSQHLVVYAWSSDSEPCKQDLQILRQIHAKHGKQVTIVGINLDSNSKQLSAYLQANPIPWTTLYEAGGIEKSKLATQLGIFTLPTPAMLLAPGNRVLRCDIHCAELDSELNKLFKDPVKNAKSSGLPKKDR